MTALTKPRIQSIDLLKGLVMVIMAIDHVRDYFHYPANFFDPADPAHTTLPIFFTRWITHFCAPTFCFLAGLSAFMVGKRKTPAELSSYLLKRGLWLILMELTIVNFGWFFDVQFRTVFIGVIWSLGVSMVCLAGFIRLSRTAMLVISCLLIFGHNALDKIELNGNVLWQLLHQQSVDSLGGDRLLFIAYPIIPWIAVMLLGYYFGIFYDQSFDPAKRRKIFNTIGITALVGFVILRYTNSYGNPASWQTSDQLSKELVSFFNPAKYPPSLQYLLMTLGAAFVFLANTESLKGKLVNFFCTFGRVPFFYYILHLYLIHILAMVLAQATGFGWQLFILPSWISFIPGMKGYGVNLVDTYLIWILVIALLYPLCRWFDKYKQQHKEKWWLSYL